ncbi:MAG: hypothetical protein V8R91_13530 [Butyricimonas faecihominis]
MEQQDKIILIGLEMSLIIWPEPFEKREKIYARYIVVHGYCPATGNENGNILHGRIE